MLVRGMSPSSIILFLWRWLLCQGTEKTFKSTWKINSKGAANNNFLFDDNHAYCGTTPFKNWKLNQKKIRCSKFFFNKVRKLDYDMDSPSCSHLQPPPLQFPCCIVLVFNVLPDHTRCFNYLIIQLDDMLPNYTRDITWSCEML